MKQIKIPARYGYAYTVKQYLEIYKAMPPHISTGSRDLDRLFDYGVEPYNKYLLYGPAGSGKTILSHQIFANFLRSEYHMDSRGIYIDTEGTLSIDLIKTYYRSKELPLGRIYMRRIYNFHSMYNLLKNMLFSPYKIGLIIIDNINDILIDYQDPSEIYHAILSIFTIINMFKEKWGASIIITAKVYSAPHPVSLGLIKPKGGITLLSMCNKIIYLNRIKDNIYRALSMYSDIPAAMFKISENGVIDV